MRNSTLCFTLLASIAPGHAASTVQAICPYCHEPVVKDYTWDNSVSMVFKGKSTPYKCILCAVSDAKTVKGDLEIVACSDKKGQPVTLRRHQGKWAVTPKNTVFAYSSAPHGR